MLMACVLAENYDDLHGQVELIIDQVDGLEIRVDCLKEIDIARLRALRQQFHVPMIFTLRSVEQGGSSDLPVEKRLRALEELLSLKPEFLDLELTDSFEFAKRMHKQYPSVQLIRSYHNFDTTPENLDAVLDEMVSKEFSAYKIAAHANSSIDALRMMKFVLENSRRLSLTGISMGELGQPSRVLGPIVDSQFIYASVSDTKAVNGQLSVQELHETYRIHELDPSFLIYALLGDPVSHSLGHQFHNRAFGGQAAHAVYVKFRVSAAELEAFMLVARDLPFHGFSVTMPHKSEVTLLTQASDRVVHEIGAANTLVVSPDGLYGMNTDGVGTCAALKHKTELKGKKVLLIGAGGAAASIAFALVGEGIEELRIVNRSGLNARLLAEQFTSCLCSGVSLSNPEDYGDFEYDILVNATPLGSDGETLSIGEAFVLPGTVVLDIVYPDETPLLKLAKEKGCEIVSGYEMFVEQAEDQQRIWAARRSEYLQGFGSSASL